MMELLALFVSICGAAIGAQEVSPYPIVKVEGAKICGDVPLSSPAWFAGAREKNDTGVFIRPGDLVYLHIETPEGDKDWWVPYHPSDGGRLSFKIAGARLLLNGKPSMLWLSNEPEPWAWIEKASEKELAGVRFLGLRLEEAESAGRIALLGRVAKANQSVGLLVDDLAAYRRAISLFNPKMLIVTKNAQMSGEDAARIAGLTNLELLWLPVENLTTLSFLGQLPHLRSLILEGWDPKSLPLPKEMAALRSLALIESAAGDLSCVAHLKQVREISLPRNGTLENLGALASLPKLQLLDLTGCDGVRDLSALKNLKNLSWLGLPPHVTQTQLAEIVAEHPDLRVLTLVRCNEVKSLEPLKKLPRLEGLVLLEVNADHSLLQQIKTLRLLVLPDGLVKAHGQALEKELPGCIIVPGVCLGSGWILLLIVGAFFAWLVFRARYARCTRQATRSS